MTTKLKESIAGLRTGFAQRSNWFRIFGCCCAIALPAAILTGASERSSAVVEVGLTKVTRSTFLDSTQQKGVVEPLRSTPVISSCYWTTNILSIVPEGTMVKKGDIVCELDSSGVEEYKRTRELTLLKYRSRLDAARHAKTMLETDNERRLSAAEYEFQSSEHEHGEYLAGTFPKQVAELEQELQLLSESSQSVIDETRHIEKLWAMGMVGYREMEEQAIALMDSQEKYRRRDAQLNLLTKFTNPRTELKLGHSRTQALRNVNRVRLSNSMAETKSRITILSYEKTLRIYEAYYQRAIDSIAACTMRAPCDGQVMYGNSWYLMSRGITSINEGARVRRRQKIFAIPDPKRLKVSVPLDESLVYRVSEGMSVSVELTGYEDDIIAGKILDIPRYPRPRSSYMPGVKDYWLEIELLPTDEQREFIKFKADATVEIEVNNIPNALQIPREAVTSVAGESFVYVFDGKELVPRKVTLGAASKEFACVEDGLAEGEQLVTHMTPQHKESLAAVLAEELHHATSSAAIGE